MLNLKDSIQDIHNRLFLGIVAIGKEPVRVTLYTDKTLVCNRTQCTHSFTPKGNVL